MRWVLKIIVSIAANALALWLANSYIAGIVLTSSVTRRGRKSDFKDTVFSADLAAINVPVLILSYSGDKCTVSPPGDASSIKSALKSSTKVEVQIARGGSPAPNADPCEANSEHGYFGIEDQVVAQISTWIKSNAQ